MARIGKRFRRIITGLMFVFMIGLLGACGSSEGVSSKEAAPEPTAEAAGFTLPDYTGKNLDVAVADMKSNGIETEFIDVVNDKNVMSPKNWVIESHHPASGAVVAEGSTVTFKVAKEGAAEAKASAEASAEAAAESAAAEAAADAAAVAAEEAAAEKAQADEAERVAAKAEADKAAADAAAAEAARVAQEQAAQQQAPQIQPLVVVPQAAHYANCAEAKAAGVAPILVGQPGYRAGLDRDKDGIACDK